MVAILLNENLNGCKDVLRLIYDYLPGGKGVSDVGDEGEGLGGDELFETYRNDIIAGWNRAVKVLGCSCSRQVSREENEGIIEGFQWIVDAIGRRKDELL